MNFRFEAFAGRAVLLVLAVLAFGAQAQYPDRTVRLIVPFSAGGSSDTISRIIAQNLSTSLGQSVVVENKSGAGGNIGGELVAKSEPDGYTLLFAAGSAAINVSLYANMPYHPLKDLDPVVHICNVTGILVTHPSVPAKSVAELLELARAKPGTLNYASAGAGTVIHLAGELFRSKADVNIVHVPYKGSGPALRDLLGGQVQMMFANMPGTLQHVKAGKLNVLAVTSAKRSPLLPDTPTLAESGLAGYQASTWFGVFAPRGTPPEILAKLNAEFNKALADPRLNEILRMEGAEAIGGTPAQFRTFVQGEIDRWAPVVKAAGVKVN
jgi:tripartite-type tricarboxylate transporter receptor subunit TctC